MSTLSAGVTTAPRGDGSRGVAYRADRLFAGSCFALISTAISFAVIGDIMGTLKEQFLLTNKDVGWIAGAATWGFTISIFILGPLCDAVGMRTLMRFAFACHAAGVLLMVCAARFAGAGAFWVLFFGGLIISLGNGTVEAACNPLIATIYPNRKTQKLNQFHMWFPGGIVIGGLIAYAISQVSPGAWQFKLLVILVPTVVYGFLFLGQTFPATERVQSGISFGRMFRETLLRPLFLILLLCMMITASLELAPGRWIPSVLTAGGMPGILVLCYINGLMAILRFFAGPVVHRFSNAGVLLAASVLAGLGLLGLSFSTTLPSAFLTATVFAVGVCYFWPTMLGTAAERVPKGGSLALALLGGMGMLVVGVVTTPQMGGIADQYVQGELATNKAKTLEILQHIASSYPAWANAANNPVLRDEITDAARSAEGVLVEGNAGKERELPEPETAKALRDAMRVAPLAGDPRRRSNSALNGAAAAGAEASAIVNAADNHGGLMSFRYVAPFSLILIAVFGTLYVKDRANVRRQRFSHESQPG